MVFLIITYNFSIDGRNKLSQILKEKFDSKEPLNEYKRNFIMIESNEQANYNTSIYKKDLVLSKLMEEKIPDSNSIKKYLDKDKVDFNIKAEDKEKIFFELFQDLNNTISKEGRQKLKNKNVKNQEKNKNEEKKETKYNDYKDNDIIYDLCHNLVNIEVVNDYMK